MESPLQVSPPPLPKRKFYHGRVWLLTVYSFAAFGAMAAIDGCEMERMRLQERNREHVVFQGIEWTRTTERAVNDGDFVITSFEPSFWHMQNDVRLSVWKSVHPIGSVWNKIEVRNPETGKWELHGMAEIRPSKTAPPFPVTFFHGKLGKVEFKEP